MSIVQANYEITDQIGFCGCGSPDLATEFLHELLETFSKHGVGGENEVPVLCDYTALERLIPNQGLRYFVLYQLDRCQLIEHGGSVPGWLTQKGVALRDALRKFGSRAVSEVVINYENGTDCGL